MTTCPTSSACRICPSSASTAPPASARRTGSWARCDEYGKGRALAWIDDNFDESCYEWAREREEPTLLVPTESHLGLEEVQVEALTAWAAGL